MKAQGGEKVKLLIIHGLDPRWVERSASLPGATSIKI
jgi:hypothetical protein